MITRAVLSHRRLRQLETPAISTASMHRPKLRSIAVTALKPAQLFTVTIVVSPVSGDICQPLSPVRNRKDTIERGETVNRFDRKKMASQFTLHETSPRQGGPLSMSSLHGDDKQPQNISMPLFIIIIFAFTPMWPYDENLGFGAELRNGRSQAPSSSNGNTHVRERK